MCTPAWGGRPSSWTRTVDDSCRRGRLDRGDNYGTFVEVDTIQFVWLDASGQGFFAMVSQHTNKEVGPNGATSPTTPHRKPVRQVQTAKAVLEKGTWRPR